jgi:hypothetical protein
MDAPDLGVDGFDIRRDEAYGEAGFNFGRRCRLRYNSSSLHFFFVLFDMVLDIPFAELVNGPELPPLIHFMQWVLLLCGHA